MLSRLVFALFRLAGRLPWPWLYRWANLQAHLAWHLRPGLRSTVRQNLARAFPERPPRERDQLARRFVRQLMDYTLELVKLSRCRPAVLRPNIHIEGLEALRAELAGGRGAVLLAGHQFNWELLGHWLAGAEGLPLRAVYLPLRPAWFDRAVQRIRRRGGLELIPLHGAMRSLLAASEPAITVLLADQQPAPHQPSLELPFLGQPTSFVTGPERLARQLGQPVYWFETRSTGRGCYAGRFERLAAHPDEWPEGAILEAYARRLEASIRRQPHNWLWSHARWAEARAGAYSGTVKSR